jgi:hypothetical protein
MEGIMDFDIYGRIYGLLFYGFGLGNFILWFFLWMVPPSLWKIYGIAILYLPSTL